MDPNQGINRNKLTEFWSGCYEWVSKLMSTEWATVQIVKSFSDKKTKDNTHKMEISKVQLCCMNLS